MATSQHHFYKMPYGYEDDDIESEYINPLLYKYVTKKFIDEINEKKKKEEKEEKQEEKDDNKLDKNDLGIISLDDEANDDSDIFSVPEQKMSHIKEKIFEVDLNHNMPQSLSEETKIEAKEIRDSYIGSSHDTWIQKFMKNKNYDIIDNE